ncbi:SH3 domain-containing protein [Streptomyces cyaneofuscatus]|uniref:SH3 domain-containing protein n=1 Tax=Streptomyces cyaneofuscatus TaxID=66883 RepID=UPI003450110B
MQTQFIQRAGARTRRRHRVAAAALTPLVLGSALTLASAADASAHPSIHLAKKSSSCSKGTWARDSTDTYGGTVNLRTGPGTGYTAFGQLPKGTKIYAACSKGAFTYIKVRSGYWKGQLGWIHGGYVNWHTSYDI